MLPTSVLKTEGFPQLGFFSTQSPKRMAPPSILPLLSPPLPGGNGHTHRRSRFRSSLDPGPICTILTRDCQNAQKRVCESVERKFRCGRSRRPQRQMGGLLFAPVATISHNPDCRLGNARRATSQSKRCTGLRITRGHPTDSLFWLNQTTPNVADAEGPPPSGTNPEGGEREPLLDHLMNHQLAEHELDETGFSRTSDVPGEAQPPAFQG